MENHDFEFNRKKLEVSSFVDPQDSRLSSLMKSEKNVKAEHCKSSSDLKNMSYDKSKYYQQLESRIDEAMWQMCDGQLKTLIMKL